MEVGAETSVGEATRQHSGFVTAVYVLLFGGFLATFWLSYAAGLAFWFVGGIASTMGIAKRTFPIACGLGMCLNALVFVWWLLILLHQPH